MPGIRRHGTSGPVVVFVHGWCCNGDVWRHQVEALAGSFRLIVLDLDPAGAEDADLSIAEIGAAVSAAIDAEAVSDCVLVGHSLGGPIAVEAAVKLGERCRLVVGVDTFTDAAFYAPRSEADIAQRLEPFRYDFAGEMAGMVDRITLAGDADLCSWITRMMVSAPPERALARMASLLAHDLQSIWPRLASPTWTINSAPLDRPGSRLALADLNAIFMPEVGHFPMLEAPEAFNRQLAGVLGIRSL